MKKYVTVIIVVVVVIAAALYYYGRSTNRSPAPVAVGADRPATLPEGHPPIGAGVAPDVDLSGIEVPEGGANIATVYKEKDELKGKEVLVRGKVVKFTPGVMDKNWIHIRDGSGGEGTNDLTVTTDASVEVGDLVTVRGTVALDQDFGFGYKYVVLLENAKVTVE
jgi:hypothetical protein